MSAGGFLLVLSCFSLKLSFAPNCVCLCARSRVDMIVFDPDVRAVELINRLMTCAN